jgi:pimeloyl-ACP methyl ester carboxylesterase
MRWLVCAALCSLIGLIVSVPLAAQNAETPMTAFLEAYHAIPCEEAPSFSCVTLTVPLDYNNRDTGGTIEVVFAVQPAAVPSERRGMFVTAVGGPGDSGLQASGWQSAHFAPELLDQFDLVYFDQRGVGRSQGLYCDEAVNTYYSYDGDAQGFRNAIETFVEECMTALNRPDLLPFLGTSQAIEDLEMFRRAVGDEQFWLLGQSYGSEYAQRYTQRYPQHVAGLLLDGVVDLTLTEVEFVEAQGSAFDNTLYAVLDACAADPICAADFPNGDPYRAFERLNNGLMGGHVSVQFPLPDGTLEQRDFIFGMFREAYHQALYNEGSRSMFLRELAAAAYGNYVPLMRDAYTTPYFFAGATQIPSDSPLSIASLYAIHCSDHPVERSSPNPLCYFWNDASGAFVPSRPQPLTADIPTLVLTASLDPATPIRQAYTVASYLPNVAMIAVDGGPHVIFGRGNACPDDLVTAFLVDDSMPDEVVTICEGEVYPYYIPSALPDLADPLTTMLAIDRNIAFLPEYRAWDSLSAITIGCDYGGTLTVTPDGLNESWSLEQCSMLPNVSISGEGGFDWNTATMTLNLDLAGDVSGDISYRRETGFVQFVESFPMHVQGMWNGEPIDLVRR